LLKSLCTNNIASYELDVVVARLQVMLSELAQLELLEKLSVSPESTLHAKINCEASLLYTETHSYATAAVINTTSHRSRTTPPHCVYLNSTLITPLITPLWVILLPRKWIS
jgi:hypothetical protein